MSLCAIIPTNLLQAANDALEQQGYGPHNFSVPLYSGTGATYAGLHAAGDAAFIAAIKAIAGVIWEESDGPARARFDALVQAQGVKWGSNAPELPTSGTVTAGQMYRNDAGLWSVIQSYDIGVFGGDPAQYPALIRRVREPNVVSEWKQPIDQFDAYKLLNPFTEAADECYRSGKKWRTLIDNNTWEPGAVGTESLWTEVTP